MKPTRFELNGSSYTGIRPSGDQSGQIRTSIPGGNPGTAPVSHGLSSGSNAVIAVGGSKPAGNPADADATPTGPAIPRTVNATTVKSRPVPERPEKPTRRPLEADCTTAEPDRRSSGGPLSPNLFCPDDTVVSPDAVFSCIDAPPKWFQVRCPQHFPARPLRNFGSHHRDTWQGSPRTPPSP
jgi:hypothetical protein